MLQEETAPTSHAQPGPGPASAPRRVLPFPWDTALPSPLLSPSSRLVQLGWQAAEQIPKAHQWWPCPAGRGVALTRTRCLSSRHYMAHLLTVTCHHLSGRGPGRAGPRVDGTVGRSLGPVMHAGTGWVKPGRLRDPVPFRDSPGTASPGHISSPRHWGMWGGLIPSPRARGQSHVPFLRGQGGAIPCPFSPLDLVGVRSSVLLPFRSSGGGWGLSPP